MFGLSNIWPLRRSAHTGPANRLQPRPFRRANIQGSDGQVKSGKKYSFKSSQGKSGKVRKFCRNLKKVRKKTGNFTSQVNSMVSNL